MEEDNNKTPEENVSGKTPEVNVSGKKPSKKNKVVIIGAIVACVAIIAGLVALYFTGHLNLTKKDKAWNGIKKFGESFSKPVDEIMKSEKTKISENKDIDAIEYSAEISANIDEFEVEGMSSSNKKTIEKIIEIVNGAKINLDVDADAKNMEFAGKVNASVDDVIDNISGEVAYTDDTFYFRSEDINDKYLSFSLDDIDNSRVKEVTKYLKNINIDEIKDIMFTEEETKHFKDTYKKVLEKEIKSKDMKSSSDKVKVDGKEKSCTKVVVNLSDKDVQDIVKAFIKKFDNDDKGKEIIINKVEKIAKLAGKDISNSQIEDYIDSFVEQAEDSVESIKFDGKIKITAYATLFNIYRTDIEYTQDGQSAGVQCVFNGNKTEASLKVMGQKLGKLEITNEKNNKEFKVSLDESIESYIGAKVDASLKFETNNKKHTTTLKLNGEYKDISANITIKEEENREKDTKTELEREDKLTFDIDVPGYISAKGSLTVNDLLKIKDSADIPSIKSSDAVDVTDKKALDEYGKEAEKNLEKIQNELKDSKLLKELVDLVK